MRLLVACWAACVVAAVARAALAAPSWCAFHPNGRPDHAVEVDVGHEGNAALLNRSLLLLASRLNEIAPNKPRQFELRGPDGAAVRDVRECAARGGHLYLLRRGDLWMFPAAAVNETTTVTVDGTPYAIRTLSKRPKVLEVRHFLTKAETAHLRTRSGLDGVPCDRVGAAVAHSDGRRVLPAASDYVVDAVQERLAALLQLPLYLVNIGAGAAVHVTARRPKASTGAFAAIRDFAVPAESANRRDLARGRNRLVSATVFLNTVDAGGEVNFALSDDPAYQPAAYRRDDGVPSLLVPPGLHGCAQGVLAVPEDGKLVFHYNLLPEHQDRGEPDLHAFYQLCAPTSDARWTATWTIMNKTWYDTSLFLYRWTDAVLGWLLNLSLEKILTDGYGWDWTEDDDGTVRAVSDEALRAALAEDLPGPYRFAPRKA